LGYWPAAASNSEFGIRRRIHWSVTKHDGTLYVLCFGDDGPDTRPHPISQEELRAVFNPSNGWDVAAIEPDRIQTRYHDHGAPAWFATIKRI
jgi:hypothetical protein